MYINTYWKRAIKRNTCATCTTRARTNFKVKYCSAIKTTVARRYKCKTLINQNHGRLSASSNHVFIRIQDSNIAIHVHEQDIQIIEAMAMKGNATYVGSGKENTQVSHVDMYLLSFI
ncbi:hypothetical protein RHGRI_016771 [Rhododendron griersonianum]|uniref:Uncharacterized protein n=1 Tax=Rhododendron griersonianum TaxID=479676 RepID=A0AAV6JVE2_9ERIC|nr:hypothetical protein RHGRI_016771 [Rhododendron griersonianum]